MSQAAADARFTALAVSLGARGLGRVWPNPAVGCVIVNGGRIVGRGRTADGGRPHAEPLAIAQAGEACRGATAYVSLEPCAHVGKSPPCTEALIAAGIARVVIPVEDPDPRVAGQGVARLRNAGITVDLLPHAVAADVHRGFFTRISKGRPMVTLKIASSIDGRIATATGESQWITGADARRAVHAMRMRHDAVLVGGGTARADDPTLTVRGLGTDHQPVRIVASRSANLPRPSRLVTTIDEGPVWLVHGDRPGDVGEQAKSQWADDGVELIAVPAVAAGQLDMDAMLAQLGDRGLTRIFCEGGGSLSASLLQAGLVDELIVFAAGFGIGAEGQPSLGALNLSHLKDATRFRLMETRSVGNDVMTRWSAG